MQNDTQKTGIKIRHKKTNPKAMQPYKSKNTIMVIVAHSDDQVLGAGATMAKYAQEGYNVVTVVISLGELSSPWIKPEHLIRERKKESEKANKLLGCGRLYFLDIPETRFKEILIKKNIRRLSNIIKRYKPEKLFTHIHSDPHPFHRLTLKAVQEAIKDSGVKTMLLGFDIWGLFTIKNSNLTRLYVDVSKTFRLKIKALKVFKTQKLSMINLLWSVYLKAIINGLKAKSRYAEIFYKL